MKAEKHTTTAIYRWITQGERKYKPINTQSIMKTSNNLTTRETLNRYEYFSNGLSETVLNNGRIYPKLESLAISISKIAKKAGGVDMDIIENCPRLKAITRETRKYCFKMYDEVWTMEDDRNARKHLAYYIAEFAFNC